MKRFASVWAKHQLWSLTFTFCYAQNNDGVTLRARSQSCNC